MITVKHEIDLWNDFQPWCGAIEWYNECLENSDLCNEITDLLNEACNEACNEITDLLDEACNEITDLLNEAFPEGINETQLNDFFWFDVPDMFFNEGDEI